MDKQRYETAERQAGMTDIPEPETITDEQWQAVIRNDASYDGLFLYAVKTTRIFCRPSCKSKPPKPENIGVFQNAEHAAAAGYRPCKRCRPAGLRLPDEEWIELATTYMDGHYAEALTLDILAGACHGTPYHLHRTFKKVKGITPVAYLQQIRISKAKEELLTTSKPVAVVGASVGLANTPYFITLFKKMTAFTPADYRQRVKRNKEEE